MQRLLPVQLCCCWGLHFLISLESKTHTTLHLLLCTWQVHAKHVRCFLCRLMQSTHNKDALQASKRACFHAAAKLALD